MFTRVGVCVCGLGHKSEDNLRESIISHHVGPGYLKAIRHGSRYLTCWAIHLSSPNFVT